MKAITLLQPWASLIAAGAKKYETRSWFTPYRGRIAIHATSNDAYESLQMAQYGTKLCMLNHWTPETRDLCSRLPKESIVATAKLVGCHRIVCVMSDPKDISICIKKPFLRNERTDQLVMIDVEEAELGNFIPGWWAWELKDVRALSVPVTAKGQEGKREGIWEWRESLVNIAGTPRSKEATA